MDSLTVLFIVALGLSLALQLWLTNRQVKSIETNRSAVPDAFATKISLDEHQKAADYSLAKLKINKIELFYGALLLFGWTLGGGLDWVDDQVRYYDQSIILTGIIVIYSVLLISAVLDLPFTIYRTFKIEQQFGFNRMTVAQFI